MLEGVLIDQALAGLCQLAPDWGRSTGARALHQPLGALVGTAVDPCPQGSRGKGQRVGDRWEALPLDDVTHGLGPAEDTRLFRLFHEGMQGGEGISGKGQFEGPHVGGLHKKVLQESHNSLSHHVLTLLSAHSLSNSNFPEAALTRIFHKKAQTSCKSLIE